MLVVFGDGRCPLCGDSGRKIDRKMFHCRQCDVAFDEFMVTMNESSRKYANKYWN